MFTSISRRRLHFFRALHPGVFHRLLHRRTYSSSCPYRLLFRRLLSFSKRYFLIIALRRDHRLISLLTITTYIRIRLLLTRHSSSFHTNRRKFDNTSNGLFNARALLITSRTKTVERIIFELPVSNFYCLFSISNGLRTKFIYLDRRGVLALPGMSGFERRPRILNVSRGQSLNTDRISNKFTRTCTNRQRVFRSAFGFFRIQFRF